MPTSFKQARILAAQDARLAARRVDEMIARADDGQVVEHTEGGFKHLARGNVRLKSVASRLRAISHEIERFDLEG